MFETQAMEGCHYLSRLGLYLLQSEVAALRSMMRPMQKADSSPFTSDEAGMPAAEITPQARRVEVPIASAISQVTMSSAENCRCLAQQQSYVLTSRTHNPIPSRLCSKHATLELLMGKQLHLSSCTTQGFIGIHCYYNPEALNALFLLRRRPYTSS